MSKGLLFLLLSISLTPRAVFSKNKCPHKTTKSEITSLFSKIANTVVPEIKEAWNEKRIIYTEFESKFVYFGTFPKIKDYVTFKNKIRFQLEVNKSLYDCSPPLDALYAILIHEAKHILDYQESNLFGMLKLANKYATTKKRSRYERETDFFVLKKGHGKSLKKYKEWQYLQLSKKDLKTKKCYYYTPNEIDLWLQKKEDSMNTYFQKYCPDFYKKEQRQIRRRKVHRRR